MSTILITGASTGLGLALAKALMSTEHTLFLTAREESLHRFKEHQIEESDKIKLRPLDVCSEVQRKKLIQEIDTVYGGTDILINNAGICYRTVIEHADRESQSRQMEINFVAPLQLIQLCLTSMKQKKSGTIVNISSAGGFMSMPTMGMYSASKFALEMASDALRHQVSEWNINVMLVQPGFLNSDGYTRVNYTIASRRASQDDSDPYYNHYKDMSRLIDLCMRSTPFTPEIVARKVVKAIFRSRIPARIKPTTDADFLAAIRNKVPDKFYFPLMYSILPKLTKWGETVPSCSHETVQAAGITGMGSVA